MALNDEDDVFGEPLSRVSAHREEDEEAVVSAPATPQPDDEDDPDSDHSPIDLSPEEFPARVASSPQTPLATGASSSAYKPSVDELFNPFHSPDTPREETRRSVFNRGYSHSRTASVTSTGSPIQPIFLSFKPKMPNRSQVPKPGPAVLMPGAGLDQWLEQAKLNRYLPEWAMKALCELVKELLMEESNIQPVRSPVTICGDIHGQFYDLLELFRVAGGMPGETNVQEPTTVIDPADIEPPTEITDPKLKKKIRQDSGLASIDDDEDDEEESRGRPRTADQNSRGGSRGNDSAIGSVNEVTGTGSQNFIFLGDFVDRGYFSLETFTLLMCLKAKYPDKITLVRGNHESRQITQVYGFYEECSNKYGNASVWKSCCQVFDFLVLAAIVDGEVLCVHGGLSPEIRTLDQIRVVARAQEIPHEGAFCDLVWSDPDDVETWAVSPRGAGWLFGDKVASEFNHVNGLKLIARAHQLVNEGYKYHFPQKSVVTVWSAPNYCYRCGNVASIMNVTENQDPKFSIFSAVPEDMRAVPAGRRGAGEYFL